MAAADFTDATPAPNPMPKKFYVLGVDKLGEIPWLAGQTFGQAVSAALPAGLKARTNTTDFILHIAVEAIEL